MGSCSDTLPPAATSADKHVALQSISVHGFARAHRVDTQNGVDSQSYNINHRHGTAYRAA
jgi:hypothetical protein